MAVRFRVLGPVEALDAAGRPLPLGGERQRALLAALLARAGEVVSADRLADLLWGDDQPDHPAGALHSQVARLRQALRAGTPGAGHGGAEPGGDPGGEGGWLLTRPPGYLLAVRPEEVDAGRFERLLAEADAAPPPEAARLLGEALALWRGPAYAGFADREVAQLEAIRLEEARLAAHERHAAALLDSGRAADAVPAAEAFVAEHPLRERARATLMRALYALGRQAEALEAYQDYRVRLAADLGLEPSPALQRLQAQVLRQELPQGAAAGLAAPAAGPAAAAAAGPGQAPTAGLAGLRVRYLPVPGGPPVAWASAGDGPRLVALPGWVSSLEVMASGRDPRSSLLERLARRLEVVLYDRRGTGLSGGEVDDFGLAADLRELQAVVEAAGAPVALLAMSGAGPAAIALAAERPELVSRLVLYGTYADGPAVFTNPELRRLIVGMVRAHWGMGSRLIADLYRPGSSDEAARHLARVLRDSADREVAARYLEAVYDADVAALLPRVRAPALVLHYRGDRVVPFAGGRQLAASLPQATFLPLDGSFHVPDTADLDRVVAAVTAFLDPAAAAVVR
jgi:DNA-binding SARP family transcriptional activator/pimeloyl-ACP methyl ester carboxylesterase